jgi:hypothetical protein
MKFLINDENAQAIEAYIPPKAIAEVKPATMSVSLQDGKVIVFWSNPGALQKAETITGPWNDIVGAASPHTVPADSKEKYYRVRH